MRKILLSITIILLFAIIMPACGQSQSTLDKTGTQIAADIFATQTANVSPRITNQNSIGSPKIFTAPTLTQTLIPTPTPRLMAAALTLDDLPSSFQAIPENEFFDIETGLPVNSIVFGFEDEGGSQTVWGYLTPHPSVTEQITFDRLMPELMDTYAAGFGANSRPAILPGVEDIGESQTGFTFTTVSMDSTIRWEIVIFRRGEIGVTLLSVYDDSDDPAVQASDIANLLDDRLAELLGIYH